MSEKMKIKIKNSIEIKVYEKSIIIDGKTLFLKESPSKELIKNMKEIILNTYEIGYNNARKEIRRSLGL